MEMTSMIAALGVAAELTDGNGASDRNPEVRTKSLTNGPEVAVNNDTAKEAATALNASVVPVNMPVNDNNNANASKITAKPKKKFRVNFKDGPDIVAGYMEPPDPWRNTDDWSAEDLENAYRQACCRHAIKPLPCVIQQLKIFKNIKDRYELLNLKGEKLDVKHVECLEEILRRVQFRNINFEATHLDEECAVALFDMVEHYESACKVDISFNKNLGIRGWQACARAIKRTPCLAHLDARNCDLNDRFIPIIGRSLRMGCHLTTLHLENASLAGRSLMILVAALKVNEMLRELFLGDNKLMPTDAVQLGQLLNCNHHLSLLDLRNNPIQDTGLNHVSEGLHKQNLGSGLNTLVLWNTQITFQGMNALCPVLISSSSLQTLNLAHNNINNEGIFRLKDSLLTNTSLLRLGLLSTKVSCEAAIALAEVIADSRNLLRVDLRENDIRTAGLMALSLALRVNESVTKLDLDKDTKKDSCMKDYMEQQRRLLADISNCLARNQTTASNRDEERRQAIINAVPLTDIIPLKTERDLVKENPVSVDSNTPFTPAQKHRPDSLLTGELCRQESLDSPGLIPGVMYEDIIPVVPVIPMSLSLEPTSVPDFILSPQYQGSGTLDHAGLLPVGDYRSLEIPVTATNTAMTVSNNSSSGLAEPTVMRDPLGNMQVDVRECNVKGDIVVKDILQEIVTLAVSDVDDRTVALSTDKTDVSQEISTASGTHAPIQNVYPPHETTVSSIDRNTNISSSHSDDPNAHKVLQSHDNIPCESGERTNFSIVSTDAPTEPKLSVTNGEISANHKIDSSVGTDTQNHAKLSNENEENSINHKFDSSVRTEASDPAKLSGENAEISVNHEFVSSQSDSSHVEYTNQNCDNLTDNDITVNNDVYISTTLSHTDIPTTVNGDTQNHVDTPQSSTDVVTDKSSADLTAQPILVAWGNSKHSGLNVHKPAALNGINPELTTALENLHIVDGSQKQESEDGSSADEFERDLEEMLASVRHGWSPAVTMVPMKSAEQILQEAMANGDQ